ncbi:MAG: glycoside hydrolase family 36 N-terminal domain-containing protein [Microthrixaceae bacterium]
MTLCYRLTPEHDILERWCELENSGQEAVTVEALNFAVLHLPKGATELTSVYGNVGARVHHPARAPAGGHLACIEQRGLQTGHFANPFFLANWPGQAWEESGPVYFGALAFSGSWRITAEQPGQRRCAHPRWLQSVRLPPGSWSQANVM